MSWSYGNSTGCLGRMWNCKVDDLPKVPSSFSARTKAGRSPNECKKKAKVVDAIIAKLSALLPVKAV